jgi:acetate kinase
MKVLVINAGSSSIKYQLFDMPAGTVPAKGMVERIGESQSQLKHTYHGSVHTSAVTAKDHEQGMQVILKTLADSKIGVVKAVSEIHAVGHRVVHGGEEFTGSVVITSHVIDSIKRFADLAPLHNPPNLTGIEAAMHALPDAVQVACFDTAFHTSIPPVAYIYGLPYDIYEKYRVRRYGFHGTSHRFVARRCAALMGMDKTQANIITCHLGNGCSITAVKEGKSVDTSMGLTPLEGLVMGTRCGDIDPAILFYLGDKGYDMKKLNAMCNKQSGLLGISGVSNDMRNLVDLCEQGNERAKLAIDIFNYRIKKYIGTYTAVVGRLDAVVFTGGIGENNAFIRSEVCGGQSQIGIDISVSRNTAAEPKERLISSDASRVKVYVIPTDEERAIAGDTYELAK